MKYDPRSDFQVLALPHFLLLFIAFNSGLCITMPPYRVAFKAMARVKVREVGVKVGDTVTTRMARMVRVKRA